MGFFRVYHPAGPDRGKGGGEMSVAFYPSCYPSTLDRLGNEQADYAGCPPD